MKKNIAILYGGDSSERIISERSAAEIEKHLLKEKYSTYKICVSGSEWNVNISQTQHVPVNKDDFSITFNGKKTVFECAFIIIHGTPGENGILQAYFDLLGIPYTTSSAFVSALTFDKYACKCYLRSLEINMADDFLLKKTDGFDKNAIERKIAYPVFVKPNAGGSSFGVTKVHSGDDLQTAVERAWKEDCDVIIESYISGIELSHGIYRTNNRVLEFPVTQIVSKTEFFDYEAKYEGKADEITPAPITEELSNRIQALTRTIVNRLDCKGLVRIDYIYSDDKLYFLEINTVPGMSAASIIPQQILHSGYSISQVLDWLIEDVTTQ